MEGGEDEEDSEENEGRGALTAQPAALEAQWPGGQKWHGLMQRQSPFHMSLISAASSAGGNGRPGGECTALDTQLSRA